MQIATIEDGRVTNICIRPATYEPGDGEVVVDNIEVGVGWLFDGQAFTSSVISPESLVRERLLRLINKSGVVFTEPDALSDWIARACEAMDLQAGTLRETIGSPGYGQLTEYDQTLADAKAFQQARAADPEADPADHPMVAAEIDAQAAATGQSPDPDAVAQEIIDLAAAWYAALAAIKSTRRAAKLRIRAAASVDEIATILEAVSWPEVNG